MIQQTAIAPRTSNGSIEYFHVIANADDGLTIQLDTLESVVLNVNQRVHNPPQKCIEFLLTVVRLTGQSFFYLLSEGTLQGLQIDQKLVVIMAELFMFLLDDLVDVEDVGTGLADSGFEAAVAVLHQEVVREREGLEQGEVAVLVHQFGGPNVRGLEGFYEGRDSCEDRAFVSHFKLTKLTVIISRSSGHQAEAAIRTDGHWGIPLLSSGLV